MNRVKRETSKSNFIENDQAREACKPQAGVPWHGERFQGSSFGSSLVGQGGIYDTKSFKIK